jgi:Phosphotransferase enzyme family
MSTYDFGEPIARGSRSVVYAWGSDAVAKVPLPAMPEGWIRAEAVFAAAIHSSGAPAPECFGVEVIDGHDVSIHQRIYGPSMWDELVDQPDRAKELGAELGELHLSLLSLRPPISIPSQRSRLSCKIRQAAQIYGDAVLTFLEDIGGRPQRVSLCHGDLHPKNVLRSSSGLIVVDWFDVSRGEACADVARTSLLLHPEWEARAAHLPGASPQTRQIFHDNYFETVRERMRFSADEFSRWQYIEMAARLSEGVAEHYLPVVLQEAEGRQAKN